MHCDIADEYRNDLVENAQTLDGLPLHTHYKGIGQHISYVHKDISHPGSLSNMQDRKDEWQGGRQSFYISKRAK